MSSFAQCSGVYIVDSEQAIAGWVYYQINNVMPSTVSYQDIFSHCWNVMDTQILSPNFLEQDLLKDLRPGWEVHFKSI